VGPTAGTGTGDHLRPAVAGQVAGPDEDAPVNAAG
jgi:hypothetical protein